MNYKTNGNLNYNGTLYKPGSKVDIADQELANQLLQDNIISSYEEEKSQETEAKPARKKSIVADLTEPKAEEETQATLGV